MGLKTIALCDKEALYVSRFLLAVQGRFQPDVKVLGATNWTSVPDLEKETDLWVLGEQFWEESFLRRHRGACVLLSEGVVPEGFEIYPAILKYQAKDQILRELFRSESWSRLIRGEQKIETGNMEITSVYAPESGSMQMLFSLAYAFCHAEHKKVLYVNLQENSGLYHLFSLKEEAHIGDIICILRQQETGLDLQGYVHQFGNLKMILPLRQGMQAAEITKEDVKRICGCIAKQCLCELLVIDWGRSIQGFWDIFSACDTRILVTEDNSAACASKRQFLENVHIADGGSCDTIREFCWQNVPPEKREGEALIEELLNGSYHRMIADWEGGGGDGNRTLAQASHRPVGYVAGNQ